MFLKKISDSVTSVNCRIIFDRVMLFTVSSVCFRCGRNGAEYVALDLDVQLLHVYPKQ